MNQLWADTSFSRVLIRFQTISAPIAARIFYLRWEGGEVEVEGAGGVGGREGGGMAAK